MSFLHLLCRRQPSFRARARDARWRSLCLGRSRFGNFLGPFAGQRWRWSLERRSVGSESGAQCPKVDRAKFGRARPYRSRIWRRPRVGAKDASVAPTIVHIGARPLPAKFWPTPIADFGSIGAAVHGCPGPSAGGHKAAAETERSPVVPGIRPSAADRQGPSVAAARAKSAGSGGGVARLPARCAPQIA